MPHFREKTIIQFVNLGFKHDQNKILDKNYTMAQALNKCGFKFENKVPEIDFIYQRTSMR